MRITRLIAGTVSAGLLGVTPLALAAPSHAADTWTTTTIASPNESAIVYGDEINIVVDVDGSDGFGPSSGTSTLYAMEAGSTEWVAVATGAYPGSDFYPIKPKMNTTYKVVFGGYTEPVQTPYSDNYTGSESAPFTVSVARKMTIKNPRGTFVKGKIKPDYKKKKVLVQKKVGKKWKKFRTLKTDKKSTFQTTLPASRKRTFFRFVVKGNSKFAASAQEGSTIAYRSVAPRVAMR
ncbi:hypothetical protein [Nocardioides okcheonensis]|uniref:hypothetical protein n=1 Tax=Nocardioides okcheonensis TaxID=2894081 RepID=UPI001E4DE705|nr:hypothetical protein [Nocardioides okcheonensis]UFN46283.1 hypothetical protein LN652_08815 [Nocardioides okcheonensis]